MSKQKKIVPIGKYILIKPDIDLSTENVHGLIIPNTIEKEQKAQGVVVAVGSKVEEKIKPGDVLVYGVYAGETIIMREDGKEVEYKLIYEDDVIAFLV